MVHYSIDTEPRRVVILALAVASLGLGSLLPLLTAVTGVHAVAPSAFGIFGALYWIFDRYGWKHLPWLGVPDLTGVWHGQLVRGVSVGEVSGKSSKIEIRIHQTWTRIDIVFEGTHSISTTETAGLLVTNPKHIQLSYGYYKRPKDATGSRQEYSNGYTRLIYEHSGAEHVLQGRYFSDEYRGGTIRVTRRTRRPKPGSA